MQSKILLIYTGGTIGMNRNPHTGALEPFDFEHLLYNVPELKQFDTKIDTIQFEPPIDSSDMTPARWTELSHIIASHYDAYDGFVVLHGTDTMAYTASALSYLLENLTKAVIITGSQLPIGMLRTDGKENLITSIEIAAAKDHEGHALVPEVGIYFNGRLLRGNRTTKQSAEEFNAFESFNYPHLVDAGINITYHTERMLKPDWDKPMIPHFKLDNYILALSRHTRRLGAPRDCHTKSEEYRHAYLRFGQCPTTTLGDARAERGYAQRQGGDQHQPVYSRCSRNGPIRHGVSVTRSGGHQRLRFNSGKCGDQTDVSAIDF